jgi:hypothetical protein
MDLVADPATDLFAPLPHGQGQTVLREALLVADHNAYQETGTNRGLRGSLFGRSGVGLHAGIPALERGPQVIVQDLRPNLEQ